MMVMPVSTAPVLRRHRRSSNHRRSDAASQQTATSESSAVSTATSAATALPHAEPCFNYFELFPEEVGATGNVEIYDRDEAHYWELVGRRVSAAEAEKDGGCVKIMLEGENNEAAAVYYNITDSDDEVYGRASYLSASTVAEPITASCALKEEPSVFSDHCSETCSMEAESESCSACTSPCRSTSSMHCLYPATCGSN